MNSALYYLKMLNMGKALICLVVVFVSLSTAIAQSFEEAVREQDSLYQANIKKSRLYGVYIPKDMTEAFKELDRLSDKASKDKVKSAPESLIAERLYFGLGRWMSYNWNFVEGSRFSKYLNDLGLKFEDEMIKFMLVSYHRHLSNKPQEIESRVKTIVEKREAKKVKAAHLGEVIQSKSIQHDTIPPERRK